jgi:hypothetical protein
MESIEQGVVGDIVRPVTLRPGVPLEYAPAVAPRAPTKCETFHGVGKSIVSNNGNPSRSRLPLALGGSRCQHSFRIRCWEA